MFPGQIFYLVTHFAGTCVLIIIIRTGAPMEENRHIAALRVAVQLHDDDEYHLSHNSDNAKNHCIVPLLRVTALKNLSISKGNA